MAAFAAWCQAFVILMSRRALEKYSIANVLVRESCQMLLVALPGCEVVVDCHTVAVFSSLRIFSPRAMTMRRPDLSLSGSHRFGLANMLLVTARFQRGGRVGVRVLLSSAVRRFCPNVASSVDDPSARRAAPSPCTLPLPLV